MRNSLDSLLERFPYFLSRDGDSNFVKSETVFNNWFRELYNDLFIAYCNHHLSKPVLIWKTQEADYEYTIHFTVVLDNLKSIVLYKNGVEVYREDYSYEDSVGSFYYAYDDTCTGELISSDSYLCSVETYNEYNLVKGFPENDPTEYITTSVSVGDDLSTNLHITTSVPDIKHVTVKKDSSTLIDSYDNIDEPLNLGTPTLYETVHILVETEDKMKYYEKRWSKHDSYSHDGSLDEIGTSYSMPRKTYSYNHREWQDTFYPNTEPPWNNRYTEDDYHYMNRMITYASLYHTTPLPILELWKLFGVEATMENRNDLLCKMYEESLHDPNWKPSDDFTHKNLQDVGGDDEDDIRLLFVSVDNSSPFEGVSVYFSLSLYDRYFDLVTMTGGVLEVYSRTGGGVPVLVDTLTTGDLNTWILDTGDLDGATAYSFKYYNTLDDYNNHNLSAESDEVFITVKGCDDADIYVSTVGDDSNTGTVDAPVRTVEKALSMVEDDKNLIFLSKGDYQLKGTLPVIRDCTLAHCYNGDANLLSPRNSVFNISPNSVLNLINIDSWYGDSVYRAGSDVHRNTSRTGLPHEVIINGENTRIPIVVVLDSLTGYPSDDYILGGVLKTKEGGIVANKDIIVNVDGKDYETTTGTDGKFSISLGGVGVGEFVVGVETYTDKTYRGVSDVFLVEIVKEPTVLSTSLDKTGYKVGDSATVTCTLVDSKGEAIQGVTIGDGIGNSYTTDGDGKAYFKYEGTSAFTVTRTFSYGGGDKYLESSADATITFTKVGTSMGAVCDALSYKLGKTVTVTCTVLDEYDNGLNNVSVNDGTSTVVTDTNGKAVFTYEGSATGTYTKTYSYDGSVKYESSTVSVSYTVVDKTLTGLTVTTDKSAYYVDDTATVTVLLKDIETDTVITGATVSDGSSTRVTGDDGTCTFTYAFTESMEITFTYDGDTEYGASTTRVRIPLTRIPTNMIITSDKESYYVTETATVTVTLKDVYGNSISGAEIYTGSCTRTTDKEGMVTFTYSKDSPGTVEDTYTYVPFTVKYASCTGDVSLTYTNLDTVLTGVSDKSVYTLGDTITITGVLKTCFGLVVPNATIRQYNTTTTTNEDGEYSIQLRTDNTGLMGIDVSYDGDSSLYYNSTMVTVVVKVVDSVVPELTLSAESTVGEVGDILSLSVASNLTGGTVSLVDAYDTGTVYGTGTVGSDGTAVLEYSCTGMGDLTLCAKYEDTKSNSLTIEDCILHNFKCNDTWTNKDTGTLQLTCTDGELTHTATTNIYAVSTLLQYQATNGWIAEWDEKHTGTSGTKLFIQSTTKGTNRDNYLVATARRDSGNKVITCPSTSASEVSMGSDTSSYHHIKVVAESDGSVEMYYDGVLAKSDTGCTWVTDKLWFGFGGWLTTAVGYYKGLKVKPLVTEVVLSAIVGKDTYAPNESVTVTGTVTGLTSPTGVKVLASVDGGTTSTITTLGSDGSFSATLPNSLGNHTVTLSLDVNPNKYSSNTVDLTYLVTPITLTGESLIGETGDILTFQVASSYTNGTVSLVDSDDNTVYYTSTIASDGTATLTYTCTGSGDKNLVAQYNTGSDIINSNILSLEDCLVYDPMTSDTGKWSNPSNASITIDATGTTITTSTNSAMNYILNTPLTEPYTAEITWIKGSSIQVFAMGNYEADTQSNSWYSCSYHYNSQLQVVCNNVQKNYNYVLKTGDVLKYEITEEFVKLYVNNELVLTNTSVVTKFPVNYRFYTNSGRSQTVKDFKIKPYSEV